MGHPISYAVVDAGNGIIDVSDKGIDGGVIKLLKYAGLVVFYVINYKPNSFIIRTYNNVWPISDILESLFFIRTKVVAKVLLFLMIFDLNVNVLKEEFKSQIFGKGRIEFAPIRFNKGKFNGRCNIVIAIGIVWFGFFKVGFNSFLMTSDTLEAAKTIADI